jgi:hypothetical protein
LASAAVEVGGIVFRSKTETKAWLAANAGAPGAYIVFMDAHALLGVDFQELATSAEVVSFEAGALKAGYSSIEEAVTVTGFKIGLPHFIGKDPKSNVATNDTRVLPAIRMPEEWDSGKRPCQYGGIQGKTTNKRSCSLGQLERSSSAVDREQADARRRKTSDRMAVEKNGHSS